MRKDFENFELRLKKLREESHEDFVAAEKIFSENYEHHLQEIFPRDVLGAKKKISGLFIISAVDAMHAWEFGDPHSVYERAISKVVDTLHLGIERKKILTKNILKKWELSESMRTYFKDTDDMGRDPFFALVEDFSIDGDISHEEFLILEQSYKSEKDFLRALESLPEETKNLFYAHIEMSLNQEYALKKSDFTSEYRHELEALQSRNIPIQSVITFVSRSYYKTPGKYKSFEHPKRRMRRTFKMALLKLLRAKLGNIDAKIILERFEAWENFDDYFFLLFELLEIIDENPDSEEIYSVLKLDDVIGDDVFTAEENKKKIIEWESVVMKIASLFSVWDAKNEEQELEEWLLEKILDDDTDIVWEEIYFNREADDAWVYADGAESQIADHDEGEDERDYESMSPEVAYELLKKDFHDLEEEKRKAFLHGDYDDIDIHNEKLVRIQVRLEKLCSILWYID